MIVVTLMIAVIVTSIAIPQVDASKLSKAMKKAEGQAEEQLDKLMPKAEKQIEKLMPKE